jgi:hypothetical protein
LGDYIGPVTIIGNDYQNYPKNNSRLYSFPFSGAGNPGIAVNLIGNNYGNLLNQGMPVANFLGRSGSPTTPTRLPIKHRWDALPGAGTMIRSTRRAYAAFAALEICGQRINAARPSSVSAYTPALHPREPAVDVAEQNLWRVRDCRLDVTRTARAVCEQRRACERLLTISRHDR